MCLMFSCGFQDLLECNYMKYLKFPISEMQSQVMFSVLSQITPFFVT